MWFEDGLEELDDEETIKLLKSAVLEPVRIQRVLYPVLLIVGTLTILTSLTILLINLIKNKKQGSITSFNMHQQDQKI